MVRGAMARSVAKTVRCGSRVKCEVVEGRDRAYGGEDRGVIVGQHGVDHGRESGHVTIRRVAFRGQQAGGQIKIAISCGRADLFAVVSSDVREGVADLVEGGYDVGDRVGVVGKNDAWADGAGAVSGWGPGRVNPGSPRVTGQVLAIRM